MLHAEVAALLKGSSAAKIPMDELCSVISQLQGELDELKALCFLSENDVHSQEEFTPDTYKSLCSRIVARSQQLPRLQKTIYYHAFSHLPKKVKEPKE